MPTPTLITDLSTTAASNFPSSGDSPSVLDDVQRAQAAFIAQLRDAVGMATGTLIPATARTSFGAAASGANSDITSLAGLTTPLSVAQGGTGSATGVSSKIQTIGASVAASALTITAGVLALDFRSATLTSGTVTTVSGTPASLVVPSTATLGTVSAQQSRLVVLALNNAGTIELAVVNISGGNDLTETGVISTTAISVTADVANVIYSTTARTDVAYRVIGYVESTQATAGTWATAPSTIQGTGGQALAAMSSLGYGQTWQLPTRFVGTTYYNLTGKPIQVSVQAWAVTGSVLMTMTISGVAISAYATPAASAPSYLSVIIPPGATYVLTMAGGTIYFWGELR